MAKDENAVFVFGIAVMALVGFVLLGVLELVTGIIGIKNAGKPERAVRCLVMGIIVLVIAVICIAALIINTSFEGALVLMIIVYFLCAAAVVVPVLYVAGAAKNRSSYKAMRGNMQ